MHRFTKIIHFLLSCGANCLCLHTFLCSSKRKVHFFASVSSCVDSVLLCFWKADISTQIETRCHVCIWLVIYLFFTRCNDWLYSAEGDRVAPHAPWLIPQIIITEATVSGFFIYFRLQKSITTLCLHLIAVSIIPIWYVYWNLSKSLQFLDGTFAVSCNWGLLPLEGSVGSTFSMDTVISEA